jgi:hypothetical protein
LIVATFAIGQFVSSVEIVVENVKGESLDAETDAFATKTLAQPISPQQFQS